MIQALRSDVIVRPVYQNSVGKIFIPEPSSFGKRDSTHGEFKLYHGFIYGIIESVGPQYKNTFEGRRLRAEDKVIWPRHEGNRFFYEGQEYILLKEKWILAVIKDSNV